MLPPSWRLPSTPFFCCSISTMKCKINTLTGVGLVSQLYPDNNHIRPLWSISNNLKRAGQKILTVLAVKRIKRVIIAWHVFNLRQSEPSCPSNRAKVNLQDGPTLLREVEPRRQAKKCFVVINCEEQLDRRGRETGIQ